MSKTRLDQLRASFDEQQIDAFYIPKTDEFMGEYIRPCDERLAWISGFTGSAGFALVTKENAYLFVDGRYLSQAKQEAPDFEIVEYPKYQLADLLPDFATLGADPDLISCAQRDQIHNSIKAKHCKIRFSSNPINKLWADRPKCQEPKIIELPQALTGIPHQKKILDIATKIKALGADAFLTNHPENTAWLLNIRGGAIESFPAPHVYAFIEGNNTVRIFGMDAPDVNLGSNIHFEALKKLRGFLRDFKGVVAYDETALPRSKFQALQKPKAIDDPIFYAKARKNEAELNAIRDAHQKDAIAMVRFLAWLDAEEPTKLDELQLIDKLWSFRQERGANSVSFDTICGFNANGAIIHYRADEKSNLKLEKNGVLLIDSGGQYPGATTDITRTVFIGEGNKAACQPYTEVLMGLANISSLRFPKGLSGRDIDAIARFALWKSGRDYNHGTGHGVGAGLNVHEGPIAISRRNSEVLNAGMVLSLEPGFYEEGAFGIRLENLALIVEENGYLTFETLSYVPFDKGPIDMERIDNKTKNWLNLYHAECRARLLGHLDDTEKNWLIAATEPI